MTTRLALFTRTALAAGLSVMALQAAAQNIAVINGRPIPKERADQFLAELAREGRPSTPELQGAVRQELIEREILMQEAERRGLPAKPEQKFRIDSARQQILIQALVEDELQRKPITEEELRKTFEKATGGAADEFNSRHILVKTEQEAKDIIAQLAKGADFAKLAEKSLDPGSAAQGGSLGWADPANFVPPFAEALRSLKEGQTTQKPVQSQFGWHVIRLEGIRKQPQPDFAQVKPQLEEMAQRERLNALREGLKAKAKIQ